MARGTLADLRNAQRIAVLGVTGSGKTTLGLRLAAFKDVPFISGDDLHWDPDWTQAPLEVQRDRVAAAVAAPGWVIDAVWSVSRDLVEPQVEVYVGLDLPRALSWARLLRRTVTRIRHGDPVCNGNRETWRRAFASWDSILLWHPRSFASKRAQIRALSAAADQPPVLVVRTQREVDELYAALARGA